jgi:hypothetical protein
LPCLTAELETRLDLLRASETDMKNLFYQEKEAREVLEYDYNQIAYECDKHMELRIASDRDLVNCYKSLQKLNEDYEKLRAQLKELEEAALPIARLLVPHPGGPKIAPLVDRLREPPAAWRPTSSTWRSRYPTKFWPSWSRTSQRLRLTWSPAD